MKLNILVFPYRDMYFRNEFGSAVRDLQIIDALLENSSVEHINIVNRPVSVYERIIGKHKIKSESYSQKLEVLDITSLDLFGPLKRRKWFYKCYNSVDVEWRRSDCLNVLLDFLPIGVMDYAKYAPDIVWYDLIDNFAKHNRFDSVEREMVQQKYRYVENHADVVTGVSEKAVESFENALVVPNAAGQRYLAATPLDESPEFDFGFIGFITDKLDVQILRILSDHGHKILLAGAAYNEEILKEVRKIENVSVFGPFHHDQLAKILAQFKVGLIPYLNDKLHDESPLKLYQYLKHGHPVLTSEQYELISDAVLIYNRNDEAQLLSAAESLLKMYDVPSARDHVRRVIGAEHYWDHKIESLIEHLRITGHVLETQ